MIDAQFPAVLRGLFEPWRYKVLHGGRGSGKSWGVGRALLILAASRPLRVLCSREVQLSIRDSVHRLLRDQIAELGLPGYQVLDAEIRHANGSLFIFSGLSTQTVDSIKSYEGVDICWCEEAQSVSKRSWDVLTPTIRKTGSEIWLTLNPGLETDETYVRFVADPGPDCWVQQVNWRDNPWFPAVLDAERLAFLARDPASYQNVWEGEPLRVAAGAIYAAEIEALYREGRVRPVAYDPRLPVDTVWDLGWNDSMSIGLFQRSPKELRCIGYIEDSHKTLGHYVGELRKLPYAWGTDYIPHDGRARDFKTGKSTEELLRAMGRTVEVLPVMSVEEGIKVARATFALVYMDEGSAEERAEREKPKGTPRLIECLKRYRRVVNRQTDEPMGPLHDEYSHAADMWRYACQAAERMGKPAGEVSLSAWQRWTATDPPDLEHTTAYAWLDDDQWAILVVGGFVIPDRLAGKIGMPIPKRAVIVLAARDGEGSIAFLEAAAELQKMCKPDRFVLPWNAPAVMADLRIRDVHAIKAKQESVESLIAVAKTVLAEKCGWLPAKRWADRLAVRVGRYPNGPDRALAAAVGLALSQARHRGAVSLDRDLDEEADAELAQQRRKRRRRERAAY